jgi:hypothetical protein
MGDAGGNDDDSAAHPSMFPGISFAPHESILRRNKSDPMNRGLDLAGLAAAEERIAYLKEKKELPEEFSVHNSIQLLPQRVTDTTNREVLLMAKKHNFDPDGFRKGKPLEKSMFYMSPYVTCKWCNLVNHVDVNAVRRMMHLKIDKSDNSFTPFPEKLPPCKQCERVDHFIIGIHDFAPEIEAREAEERIKAAREHAASVVLQRSYRSYLRRMYGSAFSAKAAAERLLFYKAATAINAVARGRLARRRIVCERHLKVIKDAHPILLKHALKNKADGVKRLKVFWYRRKEQVDLLFRDYVALLDRMGHSPPRSVVEANCAEIARRILERKAELILMIQKRWRGFLARRIVRLFRVEIIRLRQWWIANILKVQRTFRGHNTRVKILKFFAIRNRDKHMKDYVNDFKKKSVAKEREANYRLVHEAYRKQHAEEFVARSTQRVDKAKHHNMRRHKAFEASIYADGLLKDRLDALIQVDSTIYADEQAEVLRQRERREFINSRIKESGPDGMGLRGYSRDDLLEAVARVERLGHSSRVQMKKTKNAGATAIFGINEASMTDTESSRSKKMRTLYADDLEDIMDLTVERVMHDFSNKHIPKALKTFNKAKHDEGGGLKHYKYPKGVNDKPMEWLNDDIENSIRHMDKSMKKG